MVDTNFDKHPSPKTEVISSKEVGLKTEINPETQERKAINLLKNKFNAVIDVWYYDSSIYLEYPTKHLLHNGDVDKGHVFPNERVLIQNDNNGNMVEARMESNDFAIFNLAGKEIAVIEEKYGSEDVRRVAKKAFRESVEEKIGRYTKAPESFYKNLEDLVVESAFLEKDIKAKVTELSEKNDYSLERKVDLGQKQQDKLINVHEKTLQLARELTDLNENISKIEYGTYGLVFPEIEDQKNMIRSKIEKAEQSLEKYQNKKKTFIQKILNGGKRNPFLELSKKENLKKTQEYLNKLIQTEKKLKDFININFEEYMPEEGGSLYEMLSFIRQKAEEKLAPPSVKKNQEKYNDIQNSEKELIEMQNKKKSIESFPYNFDYSREIIKKNLI
jgi:hypothetical protein